MTLQWCHPATGLFSTVSYHSKFIASIISLSSALGLGFPSSTAYERGAVEGYNLVHSRLLILQCTRPQAALPSQLSALGKLKKAA